MVDAFNRRDIDAFIAICDPDVEGSSRIVEVEGGVFRGHDGVRTWWESLLAFTPDMTAEVERVQEFGDITVTWLRVRGHGAHSGVPVDQMQWHVARWRDSILLNWHVYVDEAEALAAARKRRVA